jgi:hypothetical protein
MREALTVAVLVLVPVLGLIALLVVFHALTGLADGLPKLGRLVRAWLGRRLGYEQELEQTRERCLALWRPSISGSVEELERVIRSVVPLNIEVEVRFVKVPGMAPGVLKIEVRRHG